MTGFGHWLGAIAVSVMLHLALAYAVLLVSPRTAEQQTGPSSEVALTTLTVPQSQAIERQTTSERVTEDAAIGETGRIREIPKTKAQPIAPQRGPAAPAPIKAPMAPVIKGEEAHVELRSALPDETKTPSLNEVATVVDLVTPPRSTVTEGLRVEEEPVSSLAHDPESTALTPASPEVFKATADAPVPEDTRDLVLTPVSAGPARASVANIEAEPPLPVATAPFVPALLRLDEPALSHHAAKAEPATPTALAPTTSKPSDMPEQPTTSDAAPEATPTSTRAKAALAWSGTLALDIPNKTLEAAAALRIPSEVAGEAGLRDSLAASLDRIDCARVQTVYDPETGVINLQGHVPSDADRARLVSSLSADLSGALPVQDQLKRLAAPQCRVLVRFAEMPLPQSVEQITNPLIIGENLQTRSYAFSEGQNIAFDLDGADYDGWLYIDYFDSEGQVLHLMPNEFVQPFRLASNSRIAFGDGSANDPAPDGFEMRVTPPFGEDIAVAMVASEPLFEALRPTVEPAEPYLEALAARVTELRREDPDFKGEWVYLFVETHELQ